MDKILYSPKEGTTGFWGLRDVPIHPKDHPNVKSGMDQYSEPLDTNGFWQKRLNDYAKALESCKEKKLEIVNPEECFTYGPYARNGSNEVIKFKEGEIFDLPIGYSLQPEGEFLRLVKESQTWTDIYNLGQEHGVRNYIAILSSEIEKEKVKRGQPNEDLEVGKIIGLQIALQLLDSLTPKK